MVNNFTALIRTMRPKHWIKNFVVFAGLIFSASFFDLAKGLTALVTFGLFCLAAGAVYIVNDISDREKDRAHPEKSGRPIASGELGVLPAGVSACLFFAVSLSVGFYIHFHLGLILTVYFLVNLLYSFWLKDVIILDILVISFGFVLRAIAGAIAIGVNISPWLVVSTTFLALFLALNKRQAELAETTEGVTDQGETSDAYTATYLTQLIMVVTTATVISYSLYSFSSVHSDQMLWTTSFVLYGVFRYLYLIEVKGVSSGQLSEVLLKDPPLIINIMLWAGAVVGIMVYFH
ncbi:decaprenyl-phosphate phosphoribosyltransferase [Candidatus Bipolaricaulota bacterium]|nr:decaprenyl-phosphate phosphoribosyltransferase [Candidatus Bipolaricaulota bacterium]